MSKRLYVGSAAAEQPLRAQRRGDEKQSSHKVAKDWAGMSSATTGSAKTAMHRRKWTRRKGMDREKELDVEYHLETLTATGVDLGRVTKSKSFQVFDPKPRHRKQQDQQEQHWDLVYDLHMSGWGWETADDGPANKAGVDKAISTQPSEHSFCVSPHTRGPWAAEFGDRGLARETARKSAPILTEPLDVVSDGEPSTAPGGEELQSLQAEEEVWHALVDKTTDESMDVMSFRSRPKRRPRKSARARAAQNHSKVAIVEINSGGLGRADPDAFVSSPNDRRTAPACTDLTAVVQCDAHAATDGHASLLAELCSAVAVRKKKAVKKAAPRTANPTYEVTGYQPLDVLRSLVPMCSLPSPGAESWTPCTWPGTIGHVARVLEYCFSDEHLKKDFDLRRLIQAPGRSGWVEIGQLLSIPCVRASGADLFSVRHCVMQSDELELDCTANFVRVGDDARRDRLAD